MTFKILLLLSLKIELLSSLHFAPLILLSSSFFLRSIEEKLRAHKGRIIWGSSSTSFKLLTVKQEEGVMQASDGDNQTWQTEEQAEWLVLTATKKGSYYNRSRSNDLEKLTEHLSRRYNLAAGVVVVPSGMAAISTVIQGCVNLYAREAAPTGGGVINIFIGDELYCDTPRVCMHIRDQLVSLMCSVTIAIYEIDVTNTHALLELVRTKSRNSIGNILFVESASNPSGYMLDPSSFQKLRVASQPSSMRIIVDNTWLSSAAYVPSLDVTKGGVDAIVTSLTKYYSGGTGMNESASLPKAQQHTHALSLQLSEGLL